MLALESWHKCSINRVTSMLQERIGWGWWFVFVSALLAHLVTQAAELKYIVGYVTSHKTGL